MYTHIYQCKRESGKPVQDCLHLVTQSMTPFNSEYWVSTILCWTFGSYYHEDNRGIEKGSFSTCRPQKLVHKAEQPLIKEMKYTHADIKIGLKDKRNGWCKTFTAKSIRSFLCWRQSQLFSEHNCKPTLAPLIAEVITWRWYALSPATHHVSSILSFRY